MRHRTDHMVSFLDGRGVSFIGAAQFRADGSQDRLCHQRLLLPFVFTAAGWPVSFSGCSPGSAQARTRRNWSHSFSFLTQFEGQRGVLGNGAIVFFWASRPSGRVERALGLRDQKARIER